MTDKCQGVKCEIYRIYPAISAKVPVVTTMADGPEEALELVRVNDWVRMQLTATAYAERVEEL